MGVPIILHQYLSFENAFSFLETGKMRLCSIRDFNDPFEFLLRTDYPLFFLSLKEQMSTEDLDRNIQSLYEKEIWVCRNIVRKKAIDYVKRMENIRVACFSEIDNSILMWSHYCRKHTGIVLSFSTAMDYWGNNLQKVIYSNDRINYEDGYEDTIASSDYQRRLLVTKAPCWEYEHEWRYIEMITNLYHDNYGYYKQVGKDCLKSICVGCRLDNEDLCKIKCLNRSNWNEVPIYRTKPSSDGYNIEYECI